MTYLFEIAKTDYPVLFKQLQGLGLVAVSLKHWTQLQSMAQCMAALPSPKIPEKMADTNAVEIKKTNTISKTSGLDAIPSLHPLQEKWQQLHINFFNDPLWWSQSAEKIKSLPLRQQQKAEAVLSQLQQTWYREGYYAHYSTLSLLSLYESVLPVFSTWLYDAKTELKKHCHEVLPHLLHAYQHYLAWFEQALLAEKATLRTCLQGRLRVGLSAGNGRWDNLILAMCGQLQALAILPKPPPFTTDFADGHLTPKAFVRIRQIIEADGTDAEKKAFYALDYHRHFDCTDLVTPAYYRFNDEGTSYLIPPSLTNIIPLKPPFYKRLPTFLQGLFWGEQVSSAFFQHPHCQFLLAQEVAFLHKVPDTTHLCLANLRHHPTWQQNHRCVQTVLSEYQRAEKWLTYRPVLAFLFPTAIRLLQQYQQSLKHSAHQWIKKQGRMLKQVMEAQEDHPLLEAAEKAILTDVFDQLCVIQKTWDLSDEGLCELSDRIRHAHCFCSPAKHQTNPPPVDQPTFSKSSDSNVFATLFATEPNGETLSVCGENFDVASPYGQNRFAFLTSNTGSINTADVSTTLTTTHMR